MLMPVSAASICDIKLWLAAGLIPHQRHAPAPCVAAGDWAMLIIISITSVTAQTIQPGECITYAGRHWCWKHYPVFWLPGGGGGVVRVTHGLTLAGDYLLPDWAHPATTGTVDTRGCRLHVHCITAYVVHFWVYFKISPSEQSVLGPPLCLPPMSQPMHSVSQYHIVTRKAVKV